MTDALAYVAGIGLWAFASFCFGVAVRDVLFMVPSVRRFLSPREYKR